MTSRLSRRIPFRRHALTVAMGLGLLVACTDTTVPDLNNPSESSYTVITDRGQLQALATGLLNGDRAAYGTEVLFFETMGRDLFRIDGSESRFITSLLGTSISSSDFIGGSVFGGPYSTIRGAVLMRNAVTASTGVMTEPEKAAARGFAQTMQALAYLRVAETRDTRGIAINVNPDTTTPIRCKPAVLAFISTLLDSAQVELKAAGNVALPFSLPSGFNGFAVANAPTGTDFLSFNRALKAKVEMYRGFVPFQIPVVDSLATPNAAALTAALGAIDSSFYVGDSTRVGLDLGVYHTYSTAAGETSNPLVDVGVFRANPKVIRDTITNTAAEAGDLRVQAKIDTTSSNVPKNGSLVASRFYLRSPGSPTDRLGLFKNGELVLMRAQILWGLNRDTEALVLVNRVRFAAGLGPIPTTIVHRDLLKAILKEKRYELLFESPARLIDHRSLGILPDLGRERNNLPLSTLPIPNNETVSRSGNIACVQ